MGKILHEGEYILISRKIINDSRYMGYSVLSHIGINTSKVNYTGSIKNFLTYAVIKDLELPFAINEWQDFELRSVRFHAYTKKFKNLILLEHDEFQLDYLDEVDEFFEKKEKEKEKMLNNKCIVNEDYFMTGAGYLTSNPYFDIKQSVPDKLPDITLEDDDPKTFNPEDHIVSLRDNDGKPIAGRYPLNTDSCFSLHCKPFITMPRNLGRSQAMIMLNSVYGLNPSFQGGLLNWNDWSNNFKLYFGVERATGKQKTVCIWKDGEKTIIRGDESVLRMPVQYAVAWCYVKRKFKTTSQFKKYVDNHSHILDGITYFEGDARGKMAQASVNNRTKKYDIYDAAALAITAKCYGSVKTIMAYCDGWGE